MALPPKGRSLAAIAVFGLASARARAQGGPPMVTDDPGTPGNGHWEINVALTLESRPDDRVLQAPLVDANYGLGERLQLKVEVPWLVEDADGVAMSGLGNALLGVKYRFLNQGDSGISLGVYPQVEVGLLDTSLENGLVESGTGAFFPILAQRSFGPVSADVELGPVVRSGSKPRWFGGFAVGGGFSSVFNLAAEIFAETSSQFAQTDATFNVGGRWRLGGHAILLFSAGTGVHGSEDRPAAKAVSYLGLQILL